MRYLGNIYGFIWKDNLSNEQLYEKCNIHIIETFIMNSQFRWVSSFLRRNTKSVPKIRSYVQFQVGIYRVGNLFSDTRTN